MMMTVQQKNTHNGEKEEEVVGCLSFIVNLVTYPSYRRRGVAFQTNGCGRMRYAHTQ